MDSKKKQSKQKEKLRVLLGLEKVSRKELAMIESLLSVVVSYLKKGKIGKWIIGTVLVHKEMDNPMEASLLNDGKIIDNISGLVRMRDTFFDSHY